MKSPLQGRERTRPNTQVSRFALAAAVAGSAMGISYEAAAQSSEDEIVVTATRREQALQDVPLAVSAYGGEELERQNITSVQDIQRLAPSLQIASSNSETGGSTLRIRGVGTTGNNIGLEGAVGIFIDGVYRQRAGLALNNLFDIARIEVLRGPQGTLFGKNTSAGALSVVPNTPRMEDFELSAELGFGDFDNSEFQAMVNVPFGENFAVRAAGALQVRDGYLDDPRTGFESFDRDRDLIRVQALFEPTEDIALRLTVDAAQKDEFCCQASYRWIAPTALANLALGGVAAPTTLNDRFDRTFFNTPGRETVERTDDWGVSGHMDWDLGGAALRAIVAHRKFEAENRLDADFGPADLVNQSFPAEQELDSAELQLTGEAGNLSWLVGAFFAEESIEQNVSTTLGSQAGTYVSLLTAGAIPAVLYPSDGGALTNHFFQESTTWSLFTHNTLAFTEQFSATLGLRLNNEEKSGGGDNFTTLSPSCNPMLAVPASLRALCPRSDYFTEIDEQETTGVFSLNFEPSEDILFYASYSRGYKAGGINLDRDATVFPVIGPVLPDGTVIGTQAEINAAAAFDPEFSNSYELGVRTQWFDRQLTLNLTGFITDYEDFQLNTFTGLGFIITNPGTVESHGVEFESRWAPTDNFWATFNTTWVEARYGDDPDLQLPPAAGLAPLAEQQLTNAPDWNVSGSIHYELPINDSVFAYIDLNGQWRSDYNTGSDLDPRKAQESYAMFGGRIGIGGNDSMGDWDLSIWGTNITDEDVHVISFNSVFQGGSISTFPAAPSMYGVTLRRRFD